MSFKSRVRSVAGLTGLPYQTCHRGLKQSNAQIVEFMRRTQWSEAECDLFFAKWNFSKEAMDPDLTPVGWSPRYAEEQACEECDRPIVHSFDKKGIPVDEPRFCHECRPSDEGPIHYCSSGCGDEVQRADDICDSCSDHLSDQINRGD